MTGFDADDPRDLVFSRELAAPRLSIWRCWTEPDLLTRWFTPAPWQTTRALVDLRPGGSSMITMRSPEGNEFDHGGVYLEVKPGERLVFTDAFSSAWVPSAKPFMTGIITLADAGSGRTLYKARVRHWTLEDRADHEARGFQDGWGKAAEQLEALARTL